MRKLILATVLLSGCVTEGYMQGTTADLNASLAKNYDPMRYEHSRSNGVDTLRSVPAGEVGQSGLATEQQQALLARIESGCGFTAESLQQVRVVEHERVTGYEVWVFEPQPGRLGNAISVVYRYDPRIDVTDVKLYAPPELCS